jgi:hypothetical protein
MELFGQNEIQCIFLIQQNGNQAEQRADDQSANLFKLVVAVTVIV